MSEQQRGWEDWWAQDLHQQAAAAAASAHHNQNSPNLFGYKMAAPGFQNPATTVSSSYDYRMPPTTVSTANHAAAAAAVAASQYGWYQPAANMLNMQNIPSPQLVSRSRMPRVTKAGAKPRGRMTAYAFFVQICREEHKKKHPEENVIFAEFSKRCSERWRTMSDKEKKRFQEMADKDKKRYDTEMQSYVPPKGEKVRGRKKKQMKDPNAPKRSLSAFFWFSNDERGKIKDANPLFGVGDIAKELGHRWAMLDSSQRQKYEVMASEDKARYEREMTDYKKKLKDGPEPTAVVPPKIDEEEENVEEEEEEEDE